MLIGPWRKRRPRPDSVQLDHVPSRIDARATQGYHQPAADDLPAGGGRFVFGPAGQIGWAERDHRILSAGGCVLERWSRIRLVSSAGIQNRPSSNKRTGAQT
jgi:hypothetical protein